MEEGKIEITLEWIDLGEVIDNVLDYIKLRANEKHVQVEIQIDNVPLMFLDGC